MNKILKPFVIFVCSGIPFLLMHVMPSKNLLHFLGMNTSVPTKRVLYYSLGFLKKHIVHTKGAFTPLLHPYSQWIAILIIVFLFAVLVKITRNIPYLWVALSSLFGVLYILVTLILHWGYFFNYKSGAQISVDPWCYYSVWIASIAVGAVFLNFEREMDMKKTKIQ